RVEARLVDVELRGRARHTAAETDHRSRHLLEIEREVLAAHAQLGLDHVVRTERSGCGAGDHRGCQPVIHNRWYATGVHDVGLRTSCRDHLVDEARHEIGHLAPRVATEHPYRRPAHPPPRIAVAAPTAAIAAE